MTPRELRRRLHAAGDSNDAPLRRSARTNGSTPARTRRRAGGRALRLAIEDSDDSEDASAPSLSAIGSESGSESESEPEPEPQPQPPPEPEPGSAPEPESEPSSCEPLENIVKRDHGENAETSLYPQNAQELWTWAPLVDAIRTVKLADRGYIQTAMTSYGNGHFLIHWLLEQLSLPSSSAASQPTPALTKTIQKDLDLKHTHRRGVNCDACEASKSMRRAKRENEKRSRAKAAALLPAPSPTMSITSEIEGAANLTELRLIAPIVALKMPRSETGGGEVRYLPLRSCPTEPIDGPEMTILSPAKTLTAMQCSFCQKQCRLMPHLEKVSNSSAGDLSSPVTSSLRSKNADLLCETELAISFEMEGSNAGVKVQGEYKALLKAQGSSSPVGVYMSDAQDPAVPTRLSLKSFALALGNMYDANSTRATDNDLTAIISELDKSSEKHSCLRSKLSEPVASFLSERPDMNILMGEEELIRQQLSAFAKLPPRPESEPETSFSSDSSSASADIDQYERRHSPRGGRSRCAGSTPHNETTSTGREQRKRRLTEVEAEISLPIRRARGRQSSR